MQPVQFACRLPILIERSDQSTERHWVQRVEFITIRAKLLVAIAGLHLDDMPIDTLQTAKRGGIQTFMAAHHQHFTTLTSRLCTQTVYPLPLTLIKPVCQRLALHG